TSKSSHSAISCRIEPDPTTLAPKRFYDRQPSALGSSRPATRRIDFSVATGSAETRYGRAGGFLPLLATKLTQSPWFLNTPKVFQPPFLHWSLDVGSDSILATKISPPPPAGVVWKAPAVVGRSLEAVSPVM